jgi:uncharacterized protein with PIN domain
MPFEGPPTSHPKAPGVLTLQAVKHIERQIEERSLRPLPSSWKIHRFYRCPDCYAVWPAGSRYERVSKDTVRGFYDHSLIWKPWPE